jgi:hypothetical protein
LPGSHRRYRSTMSLALRRANVSRKGGHWQDDDYDVFDGKDDLVGRIYRVNASAEIWFWGVSFMLTNRKSYGRADSLDDAKAAFRLEYEKWQTESADGQGCH